MKVAVACDHKGYLIKDFILNVIREAGHEPIDLGTYGPERVDFPDFTEKAGRALQSGEAQRAIVLCGSGVGVCIAANKMKGVYAGIIHDTYSAHQGVEHDDMNMICMGSLIIGQELAADIVRTFLAARFSGDERFIRRMEKVRLLEKKG